MGAEASRLRAAITGLRSRRLPAPTPSGVRTSKSRIYEQTLEQAARDYAETIGRMAGLLLGPEAVEEATEAYYPATLQAMHLAGMLKMDPYARWRSGLASALMSGVPSGAVTQREYEAAADTFLRYFGGRGGRMYRAGAFSPTEQIIVLNQLSRSGLLAGLNYEQAAIFSSAVLNALAALEERLGKADLSTLQKLVGPLSYWRRFPYALEPAVRGRLAALGG